MPIPVVNSDALVRHLLVREDFAQESFICNASGLLEPTVRTDTTIDGHGGTAAPLSAPISADADNYLTTGADGKHYYHPVWTNYSNDVVASAVGGGTWTTTFERAFYADMGDFIHYMGRVDGSVAGVVSRVEVSLPISTSFNDQAVKANLYNPSTANPVLAEAQVVFAPTNKIFFIRADGFNMTSPAAVNVRWFVTYSRIV